LSGEKPLALGPTMEFSDRAWPDVKRLAVLSRPAEPFVSREDSSLIQSLTVVVAPLDLVVVHSPGRGFFCAHETARPGVQAQRLSLGRNIMIRTIAIYKKIVTFGTSVGT